MWSLLNECRPSGHCLGELTIFAVTRPQHTLPVPPTQWLKQGHGMTLKVDHTLFQFQVSSSEWSVPVCLAYCSYFGATAAAASYSFSIDRKSKNEEVKRFQGGSVKKTYRALAVLNDSISILYI